MKYRPEIDGLRAVAIIFVILYHFNKRLPACGFLGVDIFFVISGYVITASLYKTSDKSLSDFCLGFYSRRIRRLVPALVLCVFISGLLICLFDSTPGVSLRTGIAALFGLSNLYLFSQAINYRELSAELNVFTQTWSLGVEEQFYVLFPLIVWFTGFARQLRRGSTNLCLVIGPLAVFSLVVFVEQSLDYNPAAFFLLPARFWEISAGCLTFVILNTDRFYLSSLLMRASCSSVASLGLIVALCFPSRFARFAVYDTIVVVLLTSFLIASIRPQTAAYKLLVHPLAVYVGRISYSLYLWHWTVISVSRWTIGIHLWSAPIELGLMFLLADASFRYIESPMRRVEWSSVRWGTIFYSFAASATTAVVLAIFVNPIDGRLFTGQPLTTGPRPPLTQIYRMPDGLSSWQGEKCVLTDNRQVGMIIPIDECTLGDFVSARRRVLVLGNSFAAASVQAFDRLVLSDKYSVTITSSVGASPVPEIPNGSLWAKANDYYWDAVIPSLVSHLRPGDWVFLVDDLEGISPERPSLSSDEMLAQLKLGLTKLSGQLAEHGVRLAMLDGLPFAREAYCTPAMIAPQWFRPFGSSCNFISKEQTLSRRAKLDGTLSALEKQGLISVVDLIEIFCPREICTYQAANGQVLYRDEGSHPSIEAARLAAPLIRDALTVPMTFVAPVRPATVTGFHGPQ